MPATGRRRRKVEEKRGATANEPLLEQPNRPELNLREKFAEVRRRLGYVQKRGHNERHNYNYVMAADLAGSVGDILAFRTRRGCDSTAPVDFHRDPAQFLRLYRPDRHEL